MAASNHAVASADVPAEPPAGPWRPGRWPRERPPDDHRVEAELPSGPPAGRVGRDDGGRAAVERQEVVGQSQRSRNETYGTLGRPEAMLSLLSICCSLNVVSMR